MGTSSRQIVEKLRAVRSLLEGEGVSHVTLFGSRARGDARPDSDIDIAIDVHPGMRFSILNLVGVEHVVSDATGLPANAFMRRSLDEEFRREIQAVGVKVF